MKNKVLRVSIFVLGLGLGFASSEYLRSRQLAQFESSKAYSLVKNPEDMSRAKSVMRYYKETLSEVVQKKIETEYPNYDFLASCTTDIIPGRESESVVALTYPDRVQVLVFELGERRNIESVYDLTELLGLKESKPQAELVLRCRGASQTLNLPNFKPNFQNQKALERLVRAPWSVAEVFWRESTQSKVLGFDPSKREFLDLGQIEMSR